MMTHSNLTLWRFSILVLISALLSVACEIPLPRECAEEAKRCLNETSYELCEDGKWSVRANCAEDEFCANVDGVGMCVHEAECEEEQSQCIEGKKQTCVEGRWGAPVACQAGTYCIFNACVKGICDTGDAQCKDHEWFENCLHGVWGEAEECPYDSFCQNGLCVQCNDNESRCLNGAVQNCEIGKWASPISCEVNEICVNGKCKNSQCANDGETQCDGAKIQRCKDYSWQDSEACPKGQSCHDGRCIDDVCFKDICVEGMVKPCINGQWGELQVCGESKACQNGVCKARQCIDGEKKCDELNIMECVYGFWSDAIACPKNQLCDLDQCVDAGDCDPNTSACTKDKKIRYCKNIDLRMTWGEAEVCPKIWFLGREYEGVCKLASCTAVIDFSVGPISLNYCTSPTSYARITALPGTTIIKCKDGEFCENGLCKECTYDTRFCFDDAVYICVDGSRPQQLQNCDIACREGQCDKCKRDSLRCKYDTIQICTGKEWRTEVVCPRGSTCQEQRENVNCIVNE
ncbi:MAG: hypothetical protein WC966_05290 [Bradymonadales bacterium]|jgi:uncharacterized cupin superfamily protein